MPPELAFMQGLSPRVRGNHLRRRDVHPQWRSIPACTGEPLPPKSETCMNKVYPRVYGETGSICHFGRIIEGLSPHVRGTFRLAVITLLEQGLSPRVRGNLRTGPHHARNARSIPACTGEPRPAMPPRPTGRVYPCTGESWLANWSGQTCRVYPRVYGGTEPEQEPACHAVGLSPRVRGNLRCVGRWAKTSRSIPACTREPA